MTTTSHRRSYAVCRGPRQRNASVKCFFADDELARRMEGDDGSSGTFGALIRFLLPQRLHVVTKPA